MDASLQAELAKFQQEEMARRVTIAAGLQSQPQIQAARARVQGQVKSRAIDSGDAPEQTSAPEEKDVTTRGLLDRSQPLTIAPQGTQPFKAIEATLPVPEITWMSRTSGQPGDDLAITGTNFGPKSARSTVTFLYRGFMPNAAQAVRYASCPSVPLLATIKEWNDGLVVMSVPDMSGIVNECPVEIALTRGSDGTTSAPMFGFQLMPAMEIRTLEVPPQGADSYVGNAEVVPSCVQCPNTGEAGYIAADGTPPGWFDRIYVWNPFTRRDDVTYLWYVHHATTGFSGYKGNDTFYMTKALKNGWRVHSALVQTIEFRGGAFPGSSNAYLTESRVGSNSPFISVRTWQEPFTSLYYTIQVTIIGPKGVPHE
jgi:hypothetical protein